MRKHITDYYKFNNVNDYYNLYIIGDFHYGGVMFHQKAFQKLRSIIKNDKKALVLFVGDLTELDSSIIRQRKEISTADRENNRLDETELLMKYIDDVLIPDLDFITQKNCVGMIDGNHRRNLFQQLSNGVLSFTELQYICAKKKIPYLGDGEANIFLRFQYQNSSRAIAKIKAFHGSGTQATIQGVVAFFMKYLQGHHGWDIIVRGHSHFPLCITLSYCCPDIYSETGEVQKNVIITNSGSTRLSRKLNITDYLEKKNTNPVSYTIPVIKFQFSKSRHYEGLTISNGGEVNLNI